MIQQVEAALGSSEITNLKKLQGAESYYRIRVGEYRIGIELSEGKVIFVAKGATPLTMVPEA